MNMHSRLVSEAIETVFMVFGFVCCCLLLLLLCLLRHCGVEAQMNDIERNVYSFFLYRCGEKEESQEKDDEGRKKSMSIVFSKENCFIQYSRDFYHTFFSFSTFYISFLCLLSSVTMKPFLDIYLHTMIVCHVRKTFHGFPTFQM
jgi:hypothetical protein